MKTLRTSEEIISDKLGSLGAWTDDQWCYSKNEVTLLIETAQREALEAASENAVCMEDDEKVDKSSILNLLLQK